MAWLKKVLFVGFLISALILLINFYEFKKSEYLFDQKIHYKATKCVVEIWSKASIGDYLWEHILKGEIHKNVGNGFSITPAKLTEYFSLKDSSNNLILVLNGRTKSNVETSQLFIEQIKQFSRLNLGVVLLGNEYCFNNWIKKYLDIGLIKFLFVVYDWDQINNKNIYQWPLGVATYRRFPNVRPTKDLVANERKYLCNYLATIYKNSSREELYNLLNQTLFNKKCMIEVRTKWSPNETNESSIQYREALRNSDLTLSPLGQNHECYRIYEAFNYLSMPILEENLNHVRGKKSSCDQQSSYRLLKEFNAPVRFVSNWTRDLNEILFSELNKTKEERLYRRIQMYNWYENFKSSMRSRLIRAMNERFDCVQV